MKQLIKADFYRIFNKKGLYAFSLICATLFLGIMFIVVDADFHETTYMVIVSIVSSFVPLVIGLYTASLVYSDDIKSKSIQTAVGFGVSRFKIMISKLLVSTSITTILSLMFMVLILITPTLFGFEVSKESIARLSYQLFAEFLKTVIFMAIIGGISFTVQKATVVTTVFVLLATGTVNSILGLILGQNFVVGLIGDLQPYLISNLSSKLSMSLISGEFESAISSGVGLLIYIPVVIILTMLVFKDKELDF